MTTASEATKAAGAQAGGSQAGAYEFGVLFVHGIGDQQRGHTLGTWAGALTRWLRGWIGGRQASGDEVELCRVTIDRVRPVPSEEGPESAALRVRIGDGADAEACEWLLAESWWAQEVTPPPVRKLGAWLVRVAPFLMIAQIWPHVKMAMQGTRDGTRRAQERVESAFSFALAVAFLALAPIITTVLVAFVWLALLLLRVPLPGWQDRIARFVGLLAETLGDSYLLIEEPLQYDRMRDTVLSDLESVASRCERVAIVAHSQGAALSHDVLRQLGRAAIEESRGAAGVGAAAGGAADGSGEQSEEPARADVDLSASETASRIRLFASVGSGIWKLKRLRDLSYGLQSGPTFALLLGMILFSAGVVIAGFALTGGQSLLLVLGGLVAFGGALWSRRRLQPAMTSLTTSREASQRAFGLEPEAFAPGFRWVDFWASHDPVPNGALIPDTHSDGASTPSTREVHNLASFVRDHTTYAANFDQFWSQLAAELWRAESGTDTARRRWQAELEAVRTPGPGRAWPSRHWQRRQLRVKLLTLARSTTGLLAALALLTFPALRADLGERLVDACAGARWLPASVSSACAGTGGDAAWYLEILTWARRSPGVVGGLVLVAIAALLYVVTRSVWRGWQRAVDVAAIHGKETDEPTGRGYAFLGLLTVELLLAAVLVAGAPAGAARVGAWLGLLLLTVGFAFRGHDARLLWSGRSGAGRADQAPPEPPPDPTLAGHVH